MADSATVRITIFAPDFPYPPNKGGRADVWRRLLALRRLGHRLQLVCFYDDYPAAHPTPEYREAVLAVVDELQAFPIRKGARTALRRLPLLLRGLPWHAACRTVQGAPAQALLAAVRAFAPDRIWTEGPWTAINARHCAELLRLPLFVRSHNIEHLYMQRQAAAARLWRDALAWRLACWNLARHERSTLDAATWVFDISCDDMAYWEAAGVRNISWLPPLSESALRPPIEEPVAPAAAVNDVVFLGNLTTPNNVRGVQWFLEQVLPLLRQRQPAVQVVVAGSNPGPFVRNLCARAHVTLLANPPDAVAVYRSARVLVNPVQTGSGTHMKAIEMLFTAAPIVTAPQGTCGLPAEVRALFRVAGTPEAFAAEIHDALTRGGSVDADRQDARQLFGLQGLERALSPAVGHRARDVLRCTRSGA